MAEITREQLSIGAPSSAARRLAASVEEITERWEQRLRRELPAARGQSHPDLINTLPQHLEQLSLALATGGANSDALQETCSPRAGVENTSGCHPIPFVAVLRCLAQAGKEGAECSMRRRFRAQINDLTRRLATLAPRAKDLPVQRCLAVRSRSHRVPVVRSCHANKDLPARFSEPAGQRLRVIRAASS